MTHPLKSVMDQADGFLLIGDSEAERFPALSFHAFTGAGKRFHCLDLGGLKVSRGKTPGVPVYSSVAELPQDRDDLALVWVHPRRAVDAVDVAHEAGCRRIWFSFHTGHRDAVAKARALGMEVVEIGRCPVYYLDGAPVECRAHTLLAKLTGAVGRPPQLDPDAKRRELW